jgi:nucleoside-diphosphate-sugar epimerase
LSGKKIINLGNQNPIRDFTFVNDLCSAFEEIYLSERFYGQVVNVGSNQEISVKNLVKKISQIINIKVKIKTDRKRIRPKLSEVNRLRCNNNKIIKNTNWCPEYTFEEGIINLIDWMKNYKDPKNIYKLNEYTI